jgi:hypothetical protein
VRLKLYPALSIQKRYGKRDMLALIFDLPICATCFSQMTAIEVINNQPPEMWQSFSKICQQRNQGILPIKENSEIEHLPFDDPEYVLLRRTSASSERHLNRPSGATRSSTGEKLAGGAGATRSWRWKKVVRQWWWRSEQRLASTCTASAAIGVHALNALRKAARLMDDTVTAILVVSAGALLLALLIPRLAVTLEELVEALW